MKRIILIISGIMFIIDSHGQLSSEITDQIVCKIRSEFIISIPQTDQSITGIPAFDKISSSYQAISVRKLYTGKKSSNLIYIVKFPIDADIQKVIKDFENSGVVEYAEPDFIGIAGGVRGFVPNDLYYSRQWGLKNDGTFPLYPAVAGADIDMENAWEIEQGDSSIIVAIIDSGCKMNHPELSGRMWKNVDETPGNGVDDDGNTFIDDTDGWDFANNDNDPTDDLGHGTNVTGIIGATGNNSTGYAGVDWNCKLMPLKGLNTDNWGYYSWWEEAIAYAVDNGARVINMSIGGNSHSISFNDAVNYALNNQVVIVACMMNTNSDETYYPAGFPGLIAIGSTDPDDQRSVPFFWDPLSGSNYGAHISVVAPGNYIYGLHYLSNTSYNTYWGGTSQATPHVAGLSALLLSQDPTRTPEEIKWILETTAEDQVGDPLEDTPGWDQYYGNGRINAFQALSVVGIGEDASPEQDFRVYPNPAKGLVNLNLPGNRFLIAFIKVFNTTGQLVYTSRQAGKEHTFNLSGPSGLYFITIERENQMYTESLLIK